MWEGHLRLRVTNRCLVRQLLCLYPFPHFSHLNSLPLVRLPSPLAWRAHAPVRGGAQGPALIPALAQTGLAMVVWALATAVGLFIA